MKPPARPWFVYTRRPTDLMWITPASWQGWTFTGIAVVVLLVAVYMLLVPGRYLAFLGVVALVAAANVALALLKGKLVDWG